MNVCRVCLRTAGVYYKMYSVQEGLQLGEILKLCVPEVDLSLSKLPVLCETCMGLLSAAYTLRKTCLKTESQINEYLRSNKSNVTPLTVVELKDIVQAVYKNVEPPPPLIQRLGQPEGVPIDFDKVLPKLTPIQPKSFMNVPNSTSYLVQNTSSEAPIMPVCVQAPLIVCGITNSTSDMKNSTSVVPALVLSPTKAPQSIDTTVSSSTAKQGAPPKAKRTRAKRNTQEESSSKSIDPKSSLCTIGNVVSLHNETEEKKELDAAEKSETAKEGVMSQPDSSKESSVLAEGPPKDDTNTAVEQTSTEESRHENSQETPDPVASDEKAADSDDVIITGFGNTEPVVITDDEDDEVQVVSETRLSSDVGSLIKNTPRIENMDVPELVSVTRVDPVNPVQQSSRGGNRRFFTGQSGPSTVQGSNSNSAKNSSTEPKPIKVVNPKTNQVQIIGYILNPDSQAARKASSVNSRQRSTTKSYTISENKNTPNTSVSKPSTITSVKSTSSVQSTENTLKPTEIKQENSVTNLKLSKKSDHILPDRGPDSEDEDNPDYVSVADLRPKDTSESTVRVKREVPSDDEDSSTSHSAKKQKTSNDVPDTTSENPIHMVPFVKLEPIDASEYMKQDALEAVDPLSTFGQDSVDSPKVQDDSDPDYSPDILDLMPSPPGSPAADRPKRQNRPPARYSENPEEGKKRRRRSKKAQQPEDAAAAAAGDAAAVAETSTSTKKKGRPKKSDTQPTEPEVETVIGQAGVYHFLSDFNLASQPEPKKRGRKKKQANLEQEPQSVGLFHSLFGDIAETLPAADIHGDLTNTSSQYSSGIYGENLELDASMSNSENARLGMDENSEKNPIDTCQNSNLDNDQADISQNSKQDSDQVDTCQNSNLETDPADSRSHTSVSVGDENTQNVAYDGNSQIQSDQDAMVDPLNNDNAVDDPLNNDSVSSNNMNRDEFVPSAENSVSNSISALSEDRKTSDEASEHCDKVDALAAVADEEEEEVVDVPEFVSLDALQSS